MTVGTLKFRPRMEDHGRKISCRAENPLLPNSVKVDEKVLEVFCKYRNQLSVVKISCLEVNLRDKIVQKETFFVVF